MMENNNSRNPEECPVPPDPARTRLLETFLDPAKIIAGLLAVAVPVAVSVFKLAEKLPNSIRPQPFPDTQADLPL
jgi:hypothetical protein